MAQKREPTHALLVRWGKFEVQALGVPAIIAVIVVAVLGAKWLGLI